MTLLFLLEKKNIITIQVLVLWLGVSPEAKEKEYQNQRVLDQIGHEWQNDIVSTDVRRAEHGSKGQSAEERGEEPEDPEQTRGHTASPLARERKQEGDDVADDPHDRGNGVDGGGADLDSVAEVDDGEDDEDGVEDEPAHVEEGPRDGALDALVDAVGLNGTEGHQDEGWHVNEDGLVEAGGEVGALRVPREVRVPERVVAEAMARGVVEERVDDAVLARVHLRRLNIRALAKGYNGGDEIRMKLCHQC